MLTTSENLNENIVSNETNQEDTNTNELMRTDSNTYEENEEISTLIRLSNFNKSINYNDITFAFNQFKLASPGIHIPICYDNQSKLFNIGHSYSLVFIEFINEEETRNAYNNKILRNKLRFIYGDDLHIQYSNKNELIQLLFPTYFCRFSESLQQNIDYESLIPNNENSLFLDYTEMETLTNICQSPDVYSNYKSEERPFNFIISLCKYYPWSKSTKNYNNKIFNFYKNIILILNQHIEEKKFNNKLNKSLLATMVKVGVECPGFTNTQKRAIIKKYDDIENYKEMMVKKDSSEQNKRRFERSNMNSVTNTTSTPVNSTYSTSNYNINDDSSNNTIDGNDQSEDENKSNEEYDEDNKYEKKEFKNSFNQENGLAIEISADSEYSDNEENQEKSVSADKLMGNESSKTYVNDPNNQIMDFINKQGNGFLTYNYGQYPIQAVPAMGEYYNMYGNYEGYGYYGYGNYDYNIKNNKNGTYLTCEKLENSMRNDKKYNWNGNSNKYNQKSSIPNKGNKQDTIEYGVNKKGARGKVKNYPDIPIQLARSMVNKTPDCNELFKEYCGILDSWYRQKLSKEIDMRVEERLKEMNYNMTQSDKIIKLLRNLQLEPLFDIDEPIESKLLKLVAEILRLQGIEKTFSDYKNNSIDSFKNQIRKLTENINNIYQIMNVEKSQKELVTLNNQLNSLSQFNKFTSKEKYDENIQDLLLNAFNYNGNNNNINNKNTGINTNTSTPNNLRRVKSDLKRGFNNNNNIINNNMMDKERKGRSNSNFNNNNNNNNNIFGMNNYNYNNNINNNNKRFSFSNVNNINNNNKNSMNRDNSTDFHRSNKNLINSIMEGLSSLNTNQNQNNNYPMKNKSINGINNNNNGIRNQEKMNYKNNRRINKPIINSNNNNNNNININDNDNEVDSDTKMNKNFSTCASNETLIQESSQILYGSNDTLNNEEIINTCNDNTNLSNCESLESSTSKETYVNNQDKNNINKETDMKTTGNDLNSIIKGIILNKPETNEIEIAN